jgi:hypothetical protein
MFFFCCFMLPIYSFISLSRCPSYVVLLGTSMASAPAYSLYDFAPDFQIFTILPLLSLSGSNRSIQLGIPTANIPADGLSEFPDLKSGVYYGVSALDPTKFKEDPNGPDGKSTTPTLYPCVLSIGYNPFYKNTVRSVVCISL